MSHTPSSVPFAWPRPRAFLRGFSTGRPPRQPGLDCGVHATCTGPRRYRVWGTGAGGTGIMTGGTSRGGASHALRCMAARATSTCKLVASVPS